MAVELTAQVQYIFLDVVKFTYNRSVEAQSQIILYLNDIVKHCISNAGISEEKVIYLPTGDGICIALLNISEPYDITVKIALDILFKIYSHNNAMNDNMRKFQVRIGLNYNIDNLIIDVNGNKNVAGAGINYAQRVMNCGDGGQILVGQSIYDILSQREEYMKSFRIFQTRIKHNQVINIYQFFGEYCIWLNNEIPEQFKISQKEEPKLTKLMAYYFANVIKIKKYLVEKQGFGGNRYSCIILLWYLANDSKNYSESSEINPYNAPRAYGEGKIGVDQQFEYYNSIHFWIKCDFAKHIIYDHLSKFHKYFIIEKTSSRYIFITDEGIEKLKKEWPSIWDEFDLDQYIEK